MFSIIYTLHKNSVSSVFMLSVIILSFIMLSVVMLSVVILNFIMLSVVMLNVVALLCTPIDALTANIRLGSKACLY